MQQGVAVVQSTQHIHFVTAAPGQAVACGCAVPCKNWFHTAFRFLWDEGLAHPTPPCPLREGPSPSRGAAVNVAGATHNKGVTRV